VFLPFAGCPGRCVFCNQAAQTGRSPEPLELLLQHAKAQLEDARQRNAPPAELGFFGGAFTALPGEWPERFLELAAEHRAHGLVTRVRCSTRPDATSPKRLARLRELGLDLVELGIQSFHEPTLRTCRRGYTAEAARQGCARVKDAGLALGIQLMAGLPGQTQAVFNADVAQACAVAPEVARVYPCLVLEDSELAAMWRAGQYRPWSATRAAASLARALEAFWAVGTRVIRLGLAPEPELAAAVLAGPNPPALGNRARALALYRLLRREIRALGRPARGLRYPRRRQGELWGHKRELVPAYARLGLSPANARPWDEATFLLY
jgi:histone acetyltransferase (RNA polymerase elongator complex component)